MGEQLRFIPLAGNILVRRIEAESVSKGGIIIPQVAKDRPFEGVVEAVGPGAEREDGTLRPIALNTGDRVLFGKYAGHDVKISDVDYTIMREDDVLGRLVGGAA